jgi:hypothetical protein
MQVTTSISTGGSPNALPFIEALTECFATGETVTLVVIGSHMTELELAGVVIEIDLANKCKVDPGFKTRI